MIKQLLANPKIKLVLVLVAVLILINIIVAIINSLFPGLPPISSISPQHNSTKIVLNQPLVINFKKPIQVADFALTSTPSFSWDLAQIDNTTITATHSLDFQPSTTYSLNLTWKEKPYPPITFTTMASQVDPLFIKQTNDELARDYPLAQKLPLNAPGYRIIYSAPLTLEVSLKNPNISQEEALDYARQFVKDNNLDSSSHKYVVSDALYTPSPTASTAPTTSTAPTSTPSTEIDWDNLQDDGT